MNGSLPETFSATPSARTRHSTPNGGPEHLIELLRTLADPIRLRIMRLLEAYPHQTAAGGGGGLSVGELGDILKLPQSTVSRHLKTLADANLADARREGTSIFYKLSEAATHNASKQLRLLARAHLDQDATAKTDTHRLAAILRKRDAGNRTDSFFGKHAPHWDHLRAQWFGDTFHLEALLALLNPAWTVVDIGTGTGAMLPLLAPHVARVIAVDPIPAMLKAARSRVRELDLKNVEIRQGTAESLPLDAASADVTLLALVLAYTTDPHAALREARRVLKPGGILLLIDLQPHAVELFRDRLNHRWMGFKRAQLLDWLAEAGFVNARWHPLAARSSRSKKGNSAANGTDASIPVPDLFVVRAEVPANA